MDRRGLEVSERLRAEGVSPQQLTHRRKVVKNFFFILSVLWGNMFLIFNHVRGEKTAIFLCSFSISLTSWQIWI